MRPRPAPLRPDGLARLAATVVRMPPPVFAIVDGGHFDDLPSDLSGAGLSARSLFLGDGARDVQRHGPWLVLIGDTGDVGAVLGMVGELPAVVFWSCPDGDVVLYGHLRRLNMVSIPAWAAAGKTGPEPGVDADLGDEAVLFRHWDPSVLGTLMPVLDEAQFSRVLGPAREIAFHTADHGGMRRVVSDPAWPAAPSGMLTIQPEQIAGLTGRLADARRRRLVSYLREVIGRDLDGVPDAALRAHVEHSEALADQLGITTEAGQCRWTYLMYLTDGEVARQPGIVTAIRSGSRAPDVQLEEIMARSIRHLEQVRAELRPGTAS